ncbi:hypothetical protein SIM91_00755 [Rhodococcus opacus]|uniref:hypothetical protein n=1 Tax=Rhodococcus opacus TaxID=37919 RepID=UPI0029C41B2D|nr:hypothetical protein [Rhodococcus opacus]MDX5961891.1 hypothetical protein [Rhodococcus opacus]
MSTWSAAVIAAAALTATYLFCIRPMRRGHGGCARSGESGSVSRQVAELRKELHALQRQDSAAKNAPPTRSARGGSSPLTTGGGVDD